MVISGFQELKRRLGNISPVPAVVAAANDRHTLQAVLDASRDGILHPILVGERSALTALAHELDFPLPPEQIVDGDGPVDCAAKAVALIRQGRGRMLVKGMLPTRTLLRAVVDHETGIRTGELMSHVAVLDVPGYPKLIFDTDGGMNVAPSLAEKGHILDNALQLCRFLGYDCPKVGVLCAVETVSPNMPETQDAAALKAEAQTGRFGSCLVEGPISLDLALDPQAAIEKDFHSPVAGDADVLLCPSIAVGNVLGKALYGPAGGQMAGVVMGASVPVVVNSRGATAQEKYWSLLLCAALADRKEVQ